MELVVVTSGLPEQVKFFSEIDFFHFIFKLLKVMDELIMFLLCKGSVDASNCCEDLLRLHTELGWVCSHHLNDLHQLDY